MAEDVKLDVQKSIAEQKHQSKFIYSHDLLEQSLQFADWKELIVVKSLLSFNFHIPTIVCLNGFHDLSVFDLASPMVYE